MNPVILLQQGVLGSIEPFDEPTGLLSEQFDVHAFNFSGHGGLVFNPLIMEILFGSLFYGNNADLIISKNEKNN